MSKSSKKDEKYGGKAAEYRSESTDFDNADVIVVSVAETLAPIAVDCRLLAISVLLRLLLSAKVSVKD